MKVVYVHKGRPEQRTGVSDRVSKPNQGIILVDRSVSNQKKSLETH